MPERGRADVPRSPTSPPAMSTMSILSAIEISRSASGTDRRYVRLLSTLRRINVLLAVCTCGTLLVLAVCYNRHKHARK